MQFHGCSSIFPGEDEVLGLRICGKDGTGLGEAGSLVTMATYARRGKYAMHTRRWPADARQAPRQKRPGRRPRWRERRPGISCARAQNLRSRPDRVFETVRQRRVVRSREAVVA